jgi:hypothetical protein
MESLTSGHSDDQPSPHDQHPTTDIHAFDIPEQLEPTAPVSEELATTARSSSYENLYHGISTEPEAPFEPTSAHEMDIGDRFDSRHKEPHLQGVGRASSFEELYVAAVSAPPEEEASFVPQGESAGSAASWICLLQ